MNVQIVCLTDTGFESVHFDVDAENVLPAMEIRGYIQRGTVTSPHVREELRGLPRFAGLQGPMWNGNGIRYEDSRANAALSA